MRSQTTSRQKNFDVIVVGARCAGSTAARLLAAQGRSVLAVDRASFPSDTLSTHAITSSGVALLRRWGLESRLEKAGTPPVPRTVLTVDEVSLEPPPDRDRSRVNMCPRRFVLDHLLLQAAQEAGVEARQQTRVTQLLWDRSHTRVTGVELVDASGEISEVHADVVVGADGRRSRVATDAEATRYDVRPGGGGGYYAYFRSEQPWEHIELAFCGHEAFAAAFPTNDGEVCVVAGLPSTERIRFRSGVDRVHSATVTQASSKLGAWLDKAELCSKYRGFPSTSGFFRVPRGPGWALVGDAGSYLDPITGQGITDAFRDAELLALLIDEPSSDGVDPFQFHRDRLAQDCFRLTHEIAGGAWSGVDDLVGLFLELAGARERAEVELALLIDDGRGGGRDRTGSTAQPAVAATGRPQEVSA